MLMKAETAVRGCHCLGDMGVGLRQVLARPWIAVGVCHMLLFFLLKKLRPTFGKIGNHFTVIAS